MSGFHLIPGSFRFLTKTKNSTSGFPGIPQGSDSQLNLLHKNTTKSHKDLAKKDPDNIRASRVFGCVSASFNGEREKMFKSHFTPGSGGNLPHLSRL
ncbi:hypothetical protein JOB18_047905 [Solea senegalensis]|uniref:Uncharacterized protein n=1 Tax=Solea senegalensis TaxID=28829 RepID=A0AAV6QFJ8_SOLSE|nr:hypothetical protein JOB18_047905 [Solea senegalensis]